MFQNVATFDKASLYIANHVCPMLPFRPKLTRGGKKDGEDQGGERHAGGRSLWCLQRRSAWSSCVSGVPLNGAKRLESSSPTPCFGPPGHPTHLTHAKENADEKKLS